MATESLAHVAVLAVASVAAFTDVRGGKIPNWLTLPAIGLAPIVHGVVDGFGGLLGSLVGALACSVVPLILYYLKAMAGGDVKVFVAIGAIGGVYVGFETQFLAVAIAAIYAIGQLVWSGKLLRSLANVFFIIFNPVLPRRRRRKLAPELLHRIRLGAAVALGAAIAVAGHHRWLIG